MEQKYFPIGIISYSITPGDMDSYNKLADWKNNVGGSALNFIDLDQELKDKLKKLIQSSCGDWTITVVSEHSYEPDHALVIRNILEDKKFKTLQVTIQKGIKQITFYMTPCRESWLFVTTYFIYKVPNETFFRPYNGDARCWQAFFCDVEFDDSLTSLVSDICEWYDKQDVVKYNSEYY